ncbi:MAG: Wzz/FepE/Etk N-terminal domain-containing protein [Fidelibacterota bacterium]
MEGQPQIPQTPPPYYYEEDTISLSDILMVLAKQLKLLIIIPLVFGILTSFYVLFIASPVYISSAKIMSSGGNNSVSQLQGLAAQFGVAVPGGNEGAEWVYPDIIKSRTLARVLLQRKFDTEEYGPQKSLLQILTYGNEEPEVGLDTLMKFGIESYLGMIEVEQDRSSSIYTLTISAFEPQFAADLCAVLIEELDEHQRKYKTEKVKETRLFIEGRIIEIQKELEHAEEALKDFRDRNRQIQQSPALQLEQERLTRETSVLTGVFTTLKQQLEMTKIDEVKESALVQILDPPEAPLYRDKPKRKLSVLLSLILGFGMAVVAAFVREYASNSDEEEKGKLREIAELIKSNISDLLWFRKK